VNCVCCHHNGSSYLLDREHTKTRGAGGSDEDWNVSIMCRKCHTEKGMKGINYMANKYPNYKKWLINNGWEICPLRKKWVHNG
jgi:hypothetical protein